MRKFIVVFLSLCMVAGMLTACNQNTALKTAEEERAKQETDKKEDSKDISDKYRKELEEESELNKLTIEGSETVEMDDILKKIVEVEDNYGVENLTISPEVKHINARTEKTKDINKELLYLDILTLRTTSLSPRDVYNLLNVFSVEELYVIGEDVTKFEDLEEISKFYRYYFPDMGGQDGMYIADGILFGYDGKEKDLVIPDSVTAIAPSALVYDEFGENKTTKLNSVTLSDSVIEIGRDAFYYQPMKKLELGNSVRVIGEDAFYDTKVNAVRIPESVDIIGESAFDVLPVGEGNGGRLKKFRIEGSTKNFEENFCNSAEATLYFAKGIKEAVTTILYGNVKTVKGKKPYYKIDLSWIPVNEADGYEICVNVGGYYEDGDNDEYMTKKTVTGKSRKASLKVSLTPEDGYGYLVGMEVTPFQYIKGKKVYGKSARYMGEDEVAAED